MRRDTTKVEQIQAPWWDSGEVVLIREVVTHGDRKAMIKNMIQARMEQGSDAQQTMDLNFRVEEVQAAMIITMAKDWTLKDRAGKQLPLTLDSINALADEDVEYIVGEINRRNPQGLTPQQRMGFLATSAASISASATS